MTQLLTFREASKKLGVKRQVLKRMLREGRLPEAEKIRKPEGWVWVVPDEVVEKLVNNPDLIIDVTTEQATATIPVDKVEELENIEPQHDSALEKEIAETLEEATMITEKSYQQSSIEQQHVETNLHPIENPDNQNSKRHLSLAASQPGELDPVTNSVSPLEKPSISEIVDMALLDKLLGAQEAKAEAGVRAEQAEHALEATKTHYSILEEELEVERQEKTATTERLREEKLARKLADLKIAELNEQLVREIGLAELERKERIQANDKIVEAEKKAIQAITSMNWLARRRYSKVAREDGYNPTTNND